MKTTNNIDEAEIDHSISPPAITAPEPTPALQKIEVSSSVKDFMKHIGAPTNTVAEPEDEEKPDMKRPILDMKNFDSITEADLQTSQRLDAKEIKDKATSLSNQAQAKIFTQIFDSAVMGIGFTAGYKWKYNKKVGKSNLEKGFEFLNSVESTANPNKSNYLSVYNEKYNELNDTQKIYVYHATRMQKKIEKVRLSEDEKADLIDALSDIISENGNKMPAWLGVTLTLLAISAPRISDLLID
jgi:hypothetical protein